MEEHTTTVTNTAALTKKDLLIPVSIVLAGALVGLGLYFSGTGTGTSAAPAVAQAPTQEAGDQTSKVTPVTEDDHIKGSPDAPIKIVEYSDFDCPFCSRFHASMDSLIEAYSGEVAWVYRQFPLEQLHPNAPAVSLASECVASLNGNDAFWNFTDAYFAERGAGNNTAHGQLITQLAAAAGVNPDAFTSCFENGELLSAVQDDINNAVETGGRGTPWSILIGPSGKTYPINGALPRASLEQLIEIAKQEA